MKRFHFHTDDTGIKMHKPDELLNWLDAHGYYNGKPMEISFLRKFKEFPEGYKQWLRKEKYETETLMDLTLWQDIPYIGPTQFGFYFTEEDLTDGISDADIWDYFDATYKQEYLRRACTLGRGPIPEAK